MDVSIGRAFFQQRIKASNGGRAINANCAKKLSDLYDFALTKGHPDKVRGVPLGVISLLRKYQLLEDDVLRALSASCAVWTEVEDGVWSMGTNETEFIKAMVEAVASASQDKVQVSWLELEGEVSKRATAQQWFQSYMIEMEQMSVAVRPIDFYRAHDDVGYGRLLRSASEQVDIVNVHGLGWLSVYRDDVREALMKEGLKMRVALLDPWEADSGGDASDQSLNDHFQTFCNLRKQPAAKFADKTSEALRMWRNLYEEVCEEGDNHAHLTLFLGSWYPAVSIHRIDDQMIISPAHNAYRYSVDHSFGFTKGELVDGGFDVFRSYEKVVREVFKLCHEVKA